MKRRRIPPSPHLKKRYNLCHRLRLQGVRIDTVGNAINIAGDEEYSTLNKLAKKYIQTLRTEYRFVIQTYIPGGESGDMAGQPAPAVKFRRKKHPSPMERGRG